MGINSGLHCGCDKKTTLVLSMGKALFLSNIVSLPFPISLDERKEINMKTITKPLREEHKDLLPHIESLRIAGESIHAHLFHLS
jgi:hypothetical protein